MGTNFYVQTPPCPNSCEHCSISTRVHLGKSSAGWKFLHRAYGDEYERPEAVPHEVRNRQSWLKLLDLGQLIDEYGRLVERQELLDLIEAKQDEFDDCGYDFSAGEFS